MRRVGVEEWVILAVKASYEKAKSCVRVNSQFSDEFRALSKEFKVGCPWESV